MGEIDIFKSLIPPTDSIIGQQVLNMKDQALGVSVGATWANLVLATNNNTNNGTNSYYGTPVIVSYSFLALFYFALLVLEIVLLLYKLCGNESARKLFQKQNSFSSSFSQQQQQQQKQQATVITAPKDWILFYALIIISTFGLEKNKQELERREAVEKKNGI